MPTPTIPAGNLYMNATLYTGTGASQTITNGVAGQSFQPDFIWTKDRTSATNHYDIDSVRGAGKALYPNLTNAQGTDTNTISAFNSNGYSINGSSSLLNTSGDNYVAWQWKAGGATVSNTTGSITTQVSANTTSGFSILTYTGNGTSGATIGHGLGVAPSMVILKSLGNNDWSTYHVGIGNTKIIFLNSSNATAGPNSAYWNNTTPSSTVVTLGVAAELNGNGVSFVGYCFAPIAGYSAFGSYTGNGSADGPFIYTGFRPRFVMVKNTSATSDWWVEDTSRAPYNAANALLFPNLTIAEYTTAGVEWDLLSNGFKIRNTATQNNTNGSTYIYMAFAENPFKYANAR
jgi:hypothetical protein